VKIIHHWCDSCIVSCNPYEGSICNLPICPCSKENLQPMASPYDASMQQFQPHRAGRNLCNQWLVKMPHLCKIPMSSYREKLVRTPASSDAGPMHQHLQCHCVGRNLSNQSLILVLQHSSMAQLSLTVKQSLHG